MTVFHETLYDGHLAHLGHEYSQRFGVKQVLFEEKTEHQHLIIFENPRFGRVLALDGIIQTTEGDEYAYHEMLVHVPMFALGDAKQVLIIGGGDGGTLRETLRHDVERVTMVEIDRRVIDLCETYMPSLSAGAFEDPRADVIIDDGIKFVAQTDRVFDVIIVDSTDPLGPGEVLFTEAFYASCKRSLRPGGVLITQNGVPFFQGDELKASARRLAPHFADARCYLTVVPSYVGGYMALGWASDDAELKTVPLDILRERFDRAGFATRYYTPAIHAGAFNMPAFIACLTD
ncbi:MAG: polyamine aminopropyltransferase [Rhodospirillales bacterium]